MGLDTEQVALLQAIIKSRSRTPPALRQECKADANTAERIFLDSGGLSAWAAYVVTKSTARRRNKTELNRLLAALNDQSPEECRESAKQLAEAIKPDIARIERWITEARKREIYRSRKRPMTSSDGAEVKTSERDSGSRADDGCRHTLTSCLRSPSPVSDEPSHQPSHAVSLLQHDDISHTSQEDHPYNRSGDIDKDHVVNLLETSPLDIGRRNNEVAQVRDLVGRIRDTLSPEAVRMLYESLGSHLQQKRCKTPVVSHADAERLNLASPEESQSLSVCSPWPLAPSQVSLNSDARGVLCIIHAAGGITHESLFGHAVSWGEDGEPAPVDVPVPELLIGRRGSTAVDELLWHQLLLVPRAGFLAINPGVAASTQFSSAWKLAALQAICKSFPRFPAEVLCATKCKAMLPVLATLLSYLPEVRLDARLRVALFDICISASYFGLLPWKQSMVEYAARLHEGEHLLVQRLALRRRMINRLASKSIEPVETRHTPKNARENGYWGEQIVFELKLLRDQGSSTEEMDGLFKRFSSFGPTMSTQERLVEMEGQAIIARALKNQGDFETSAKLYERIINNNLPGPNTNPSHAFLASWAEVLCEQGETDRALNLLGNEIRFFGDATGGKLLLARAHAFLMQTLLHFMKTSTLQESPLAEATDLYRRYQSAWGSQCLRHLTIVNKTNYYIACAGTAMALHVLSFFPSQKPPWSQEQRERMQQADKAWEDAKASADRCWTMPGYAHMIAICSQCELAYRVGQHNASQLRAEAKNIFSRIGREYYFIAQGTVWPDILEDQAERNGWPSVFTEAER